MSDATVFCRAQFEAFHNWPFAPAVVAFLGHTHRHIMHVRIEVSVEHDDRDTEFIMLRRRVLDFIESKWGRPAMLGSLSCEAIARELLVQFDATQVEVSEDGENGAIVRRML